MAKRKPKGRKIRYKKQQKPQIRQPAANTIAQHQQQSLPKDSLSVHFTPHDTWFFRESRPHDAVGASELASLFPPPVRTLAGALRSHIGQSLNINWQTMCCPDMDFDFQQTLGDSEQLGQIHLQGPFIHYQGQRLYPVPLYLLQHEGKYQRLTIGDAVRCDLGHVRLPKMPAGCQGYKPLENHWLTAQGLSACLAGNVPEQKHIIAASDLYQPESRLGIARNNARRTVEQGMLYQTRHCRPKDDAELSIELRVNKLPEPVSDILTRQPERIIRLGGEGRMAGLDIQSQTQALPDMPAGITERFTLHFITQADFNGHMFPEDFCQQTDTHGIDFWHGKINGIALNIEAAILGKAHREGGWNMEKHQPCPVKSYLPAGSVWYCRLINQNDVQAFKETLHGTSIGQNTSWGRGQVLVGIWP